MWNVSNLLSKNELESLLVYNSATLPERSGKSSGISVVKANENQTLECLPGKLAAYLSPFCLQIRVILST